MTTKQEQALQHAGNAIKGAALRLGQEAANAADLGDIRINTAMVREAMKRSTNLKRHDVPRKAYLKDGTEVDTPADLADDFNILYKDSNGELVASNYLLEDFDDHASPSPSPVQPLLAIRYVVPMLAMVPLAALSGVHWSLTLALVLAWAFMASLGKESGSFFFNLKQAVVGQGWISLLVATPIFLWLVFAAPGWLASAALPLWFYFKATGWLANRNVQEDAEGRAKKLFGQAQHLTRTGFATQTYLEDQMHVKARQEQADDCARNTEPLMDINATATGYFTSTGSLNSPDEGKNMVFTGTDLGASLLAVGTTGTGKTYTVLTPMMHEVARVNALSTKPAERYGLFLMDDKGDLPPRGQAIFKDFALIAPEAFTDNATGKVTPASTFAPMQGLKAEQVNKLIGEIFAAEGEIWDKAANEKFLYTLIAMECALQMGLRFVVLVDKEGNPIKGQPVSIKWNLETIFRLVGSDDQTKAVLRNIAAMDKVATKAGKPSPIEAHPLMKTAFRYFTDNYFKLADATKSSVNFNVSAWVTDSVNRNMKLWWDAEEGVRIEDVFQGKAMGLYCPEFKYGATGKLVNAMVRARLYNFLKNRSSSWEEGGTRAILMWDEFALGIGSGDMEANMLPIQRSLGLTSVFATQTITEVRARMGRERADALLDNLTKNIICLKTDAESYEFLAKKMGTYRAMVPSQRSKEAPVALDFFGTQRAKVLAAKNGLVVYDEQRLENKQVEAEQTGDNIVKNLMRKRRKNNMYKNLSDQDAHIRYMDAAALSMQEEPVFNADLMSRLLAFKFHAFMAVQRGGVQRFDLVHLGPKTKALPK